MLIFSVGMNANIYRLQFGISGGTVKPTADEIPANLLVASQHVGRGESGIMELKLFGMSFYDLQEK